MVNNCNGSTLDSSYKAVKEMISVEAFWLRIPETHGHGRTQRKNRDSPSIGTSELLVPSERGSHRAEVPRLGDASRTQFEPQVGVGKRRPEEVASNWVMPEDDRVLVEDTGRKSGSRRRVTPTLSPLFSAPISFKSPTRAPRYNRIVSKGTVGSRPVTDAGRSRRIQP